MAELEDVGPCNICNKTVEVGEGTQRWLKRRNDYIRFHHTCLEQSKADDNLREKTQKRSDACKSDSKQWDSFTGQWY